MPKLRLSEDQRTFKKGICFLVVNDENNECAPIATVLKDLHSDKEIREMKETLRKTTGMNVISKTCSIILDEAIPLE